MNEIHNRLSRELPGLHERQIANAVAVGLTDKAIIEDIARGNRYAIEQDQQ